MFDSEQANTARSQTLRTAQYHTAWNPTRCIIPLPVVWLLAVLDNFGFSYISISQLGAVQCDTAWSVTWCSITLPGVTFFANIFAKTNFSVKPFLTVYLGPKWVRFMKKKKMLKILWHCLFKRASKCLK